MKELMDNDKVKVMDLYFNCPKEQSNPEQCPLCTLRKVPRKEAIDIIGNMSQ